MMPTICNEQAPVPLSGVGFLGGTGRHIRRGGSGADVGWGRLRRPRRAPVQASPLRTTRPPPLRIRSGFPGDIMKYLPLRGTGPAPIIAPSRSAGSSPAGACLAYQRPELDRDLAPAGFVSTGCPAGTSALPATVSQMPRWCATCLPGRVLVADRLAQDPVATLLSGRA